MTVLPTLRWSVKRLSENCAPDEIPAGVLMHRTSLSSTRAVQRSSGIFVLCVQHQSDQKSGLGVSGQLDPAAGLEPEIHHANHAG